MEIERKELELQENRLMQQKVRLESALVELERESKEESSTKSVLEGNSARLYSRTNIEKWIDESQPPYELQSQYSNSRHGECIHHLDNEENFLSSAKIAKILTRQSVPKDLPTFGGNPMEWPNFIAQYKNSTKICGYTDEENQCRLQKCLKGTARRVVESLLIMPGNVPRVIQTLERRFGQPEHIIFLLVDKIKKLPNVREEKLETFIEFADEVKNLVATMETLEEKEHLQNPILLQELVNKLPVNYKMNWMEHVTTETIVTKKLIEFEKWLGRKAEAACRLQMPKICQEEFKNKNRNVILTTRNTSDENKRICEFCKKDSHHLSKCTEFTAAEMENKWKFVMNKKFCFSCLTPFHTIKDCRRKKICGTDDCKKLHHKLLHSTPMKPEEHEEMNRQEHSCHISSTTRVLLKILPITLKSAGKAVETFALLDEASTVTLIDENLAELLKLDGPKTRLSLDWISEKTSEKMDSKIVSVTVRGDSNNSFQLRRVRTMKGLNLPSQTIRPEELCRHYPYLKNCKTRVMINAKPLVLIGQDNWPLIISTKIIEGRWNGPVLSKTRLGWVIHGNVSKEGIETPTEKRFVCFVESNQEKDDLDLLHDMVKEQWKIDSIGVKPLVNGPMSKQDIRARRILDSTMKRVGNKFETGLLWKEDKVSLPESYENALRRLRSTQRKMRKDEKYGEAYRKKIEEYELKGYVRKLSKMEQEERSDKIWYLPHFGVININKPNKIRIVFDAAAKSNGFLLPGPDLYNSLLTILLNFRTKKIAFVADIKEMFLQVNVRKEDQPAQRFLWGGGDGLEPEIYQIQVVFFGSVSGPCLAQEAKNKNALEFSDQYPQAVEAITKKHYMDDYLGCTDTEEEALKLIQEVIEVHNKGGFTICNWISNSKNVLHQIDYKLTACGEKNLDIDSNYCMERVLGLWWDPQRDQFAFHSRIEKIDKRILHGRRPTKREILKLIMSVYDPIGFLINVIIEGKIILQDVWRSGIGWDDEIADSAYKNWVQWMKKFEKISTCRINRQYSPEIINGCQVEIHTFCDASERAYATVSYLRWINGKNIGTTFLCAKARVAPLKPLSIPRLELQAALMGARMGKYLSEALDMKTCKNYYWTDSKTVLHWVKSEAKRFEVYVAQRVGEIQELTDPENWHHVKSNENVADEATKFKETISFLPDSPWLSGPAFLRTPNNHWEILNEEECSIESKLDEEQLEIRKKFVMVTSLRENIIIPDPTRFSKWLRLIRATAWMLRYKNQCRKKNYDKINCELQPEEIKAAEILLFKRVQEDCFENELIALQNEENIDKHSAISKLKCSLDKKGIIRLHRRLDNSELHEDIKKPIILDSKHRIVRLRIQHEHERLHHQGNETIINNLNQNHWILGLRRRVKEINKTCQHCKIYKKYGVENPEKGPLPLCRIEPTIRSFIKTGVDYFGPLYITEKRRHEKRYGVIFTCMVTRAIHLELAFDLSTNSFIEVYRQFGCRRGFPEELYSDNGTNFRGAETELKKAWEELDHESITRECTLRQTKWYFNPPAAPHMGGAWERLIQSVKKIIKEVLKERFPQEHTLRTVLIECENIVNSRPLTHVPIDSEDSEALTPNHFLIGPKANALACSNNEKIFTPNGELHRN